MLERKQTIENLKPLREVISDHNLAAQKSLGQNFLLDINITDKIVREAMLQDGNNWEGVNAFEIGAGPGGLTRSILKTNVKKLYAIEFDKRAIKALNDLAYITNNDLEVIYGDALKINLLDITNEPRIIIANLPYNIATPLLIGWLKQIRKNNNAYKSMSLMFQKEVANRIIATPNSKYYGRLAIISQWLCNVTKIYDLPPSAFTPPPKVNSAVVYFSPKKLDSNMPSFEALEQVTTFAFNQRRKMIRSSLKDYLPAIKALGIDPEKRAENLTIQEYINIASFDIEK